MQHETLLYQKAFRNYLRYGISIEQQLKAAAEAHPTSHYIWATAGGDRVRESHAAREGQIFPYAGSISPPGSEPGCRCKAVPYHGTVIDDKPLEPVYPELLLLPITRFGGILSSLIRAVRDRAGTLNEAQAYNLRRFDQKLPKAAQEIQVLSGKNGQRIFRSDVPANNIPGSFARYEKIVDSTGKTVSYTKTTYAPDGRVVHIKIK